MIKIAKAFINFKLQHHMKTTINFKAFALLVALLASTTLFGQKTVTLKHWNGNLAETTPYDAQGNIHGLQTQYSLQGIKQVQSLYDHGKLKKRTEFFNSGMPAEQISYHDFESYKRLEHIKWDIVKGVRTKTLHQKWNPKNFDMTIFLQRYDYDEGKLNTIIDMLPNKKGIYVMANTLDGKSKYKEIYFDNDTACVWHDKSKKQLYGKQPANAATYDSSSFYWIWDESGNMTFDGVAAKLEQQRRIRQQQIDDSLRIVAQEREKFVRDSIEQERKDSARKARKAHNDRLIAKVNSIKQLQDAYVKMLNVKFAGSEQAFFERLVAIAKDKKLKNSQLQKDVFDLIGMQDAKLVRKTEFVIRNKTCNDRYNKGAKYAVLCKMTQWGARKAASEILKSPIDNFLNASTIAECIDILENDRVISNDFFREQGTYKQFNISNKRIENLSISRIALAGKLIEIANQIQ